MILPKFDFFEPGSLEEACDLLGQLGSGGRLLAGGTDLLVNMKKRFLSPRNVISLGAIDEMKKIDISNGTIRIGACVTAGDLAASATLTQLLPSLWEGASSLGSPLIRNLATIGGNLVTARPAADLPPPLIACGGSVVLKKNSGERSLALESFFRGPGETLRKEDEIVTSVLVEKPPPNSGAAYIKLGLRNALEISLVNVAACISLNPGGTIQKSRVVLGAVSPIPIRALSAEKTLSGEKPSESLFLEAARNAARDCNPIDDYRGSAEYRGEMVKVITRRALKRAFERATGPRFL